VRIAERTSIENRWPVEVDGTRAPWDESSLISRLFERAVDANPDATALLFEEQRWTFLDLDQRANRLAHVLAGRGAGPGVLVGVYLRRSPDLVVALLAVLKAGAAYVPLDPTYPFDRVDYVLADSEARLLISSSELAERLMHCPDTVLLDTQAELIGAQPSSRLFRPERADQLACVLYTSGSTGKAKGVMVEHRNLMSFFAGMRLAIGLDSDGVWLSGTSTAFDISLLELFGSLCHGRTVALLGNTVLGQVADPRYTIPRLVARHRVTHFQCTPSQARFLLMDSASRAALASLKQLIVGGEALPPDLAEKLVALVGGDVINAYGPTETTVWSTTSAVRPGEPVTIGRPIANTFVFVVDSEGRPAPFGAVGELWIGGPGVTRGYWQRPELTAERFPQNQLRPDLGGRLYRTGDLVRYAEDGQLVYLGRNDNQVKIRGFRVEVGEIEEAVRQVAGVVDAVVVARGASGDLRLIAYLVPGAAFAGNAALKAHLQTQLPEYMVPSAIVHLDSLPLTPNGKVDRKALPEASAVNSPPEHFLAPADQIERDLLNVWKDALGVTRLSVTDNFFDLGGHSLLAVDLVSRIDDVFGIRVPVSLLVDQPTVLQLAAILRERQSAPRGATGANWTTVVPIRQPGSLPPFFCVAGLGGNPLFLRHLGRALGEDQPVYALQHRGVDGQLPPHRSIHAMAEELLHDIKKIQPRGPYYLGGSSVGGLAAYELSRMLRAQGESVGLLVLFDTSNPKALRWSIKQRLLSHLANLRRVGPSYSVILLGRQVSRASRAVSARLARLRPFEFRNDLLVQTTLAAERDYEPGPYDGDLLLVQADAQLPASAGIGDPRHESNGWRELVKGELEVTQIDCDHLELLGEAVAHTTASLVSRGLRKAQARLAATLAYPPLPQDAHR
jgi:amino acid adenylation domain-containing protein